MQAVSAVAIVLAGILAWIPYVRMTPEYDHVVEALGGHPTETATTEPEELALLLEGRAVLLIPEQQEADEAALEALGTEVAGVLRAFLSRGGRIVGMSFARGAEDLLRGAGLWEVNDGYNVTGGTLGVARTDHPLAAGIPTRFPAPDGSTDFYGLPEGATVVVWDTYDKAPVVFTWEVGGGTVILLGFDLYERTEATVGLLRNAVGLPAAPSSTAASERVVRDVGVSEVEEVLVDLGLTFDQRTDPYGDPVWVLYFDDLTAILSVDDAAEEAPGRFRYLGLYAGWTTGGEVSCDALNAWNRLTRGSRAYLDEEGDAALESELYLGDGVTLATVQAFIERFGRLARAFAEYIAGK